MSNVKTIRFYDLCRICASSSDEKLDIFSVESKMKNLWYKVNDCLSLTVEEKDRLPKVLCIQCVQNVETFAEFRNLCNVSQIKLNNWLNAAMCAGTTAKSINQNANSSNIIEDTVISSTIWQDYRQKQEQPVITQSSNYLNTNVSGSTVQPLTTTANEFQIIKAEGYHDSENGSNMHQGQPDISQTQSLNCSYNNPNNDKTKDFKNNTLEEFLKMKPNLKVTPVRQKQQQSQKLKDVLEHDQLQQQQQEQLHQLQQQLQQQLQHQLQQQQLQQQLQLQLLTSQFQPQQITITTPNTSLIPSINGQNLSASTASLIQNGTNFSLDSTNILNVVGTTSATTTGTANVNGIENIDETSPSKNKKPKLNLIITPPQNDGQGITANITQFATPTQIQLQLQPTLQSHAQVTTTAAQQQQQQQNGSLFSNLAPYFQSSMQNQNQSVNAVLQNQTVASNPVNSSNIFPAPSKCYLPITIKDDATDQQYIAHIDAKNFILPTTYQIQMKLQPQLATADGQPIIQLAPTSIPATLQLTPQTLSTAQNFQTLTNMSPLNQNNNYNNSNNMQGQIFQTALSQTQSQYHQQQQQRQLTAQTQTALISNEQVLQHNMQNVETQSTTINEFYKKQQQLEQQEEQYHLQKQNTVSKNIEITSQQIIKAGNCVNSTNVNTSNSDITTPLLVQDKGKSPTSRTVIKNSTINPQKKYSITQGEDNIVEIIPTTGNSTTTTNNIKQQVLKQLCQKRKQQQQQQQHQQLQPQRQSQEHQRPKRIISNEIATKHGSITIQRVTTTEKPEVNTMMNTKTTQHSIMAMNQKLSMSTANSIKLVNEQQPQKQLSEQLHQRQSQQINANIMKLPVLNKQTVTIRCITKKKNKNMEQQQQEKLQQQQQPLISGTSTTMITTAPAITTTTTSVVTPSNVCQTMSNQRQQRQQKKQQLKTKKLLTSVTQTATTTKTMTTTTSAPTMMVTTDQDQVGLPKSYTQLRNVTHSSTVTGENVLKNNNSNSSTSNSNAGCSQKNAVKVTPAKKKALVKKRIKSDVNAVTQTVNYNNNINNNSSNNQVQTNVEKSIQLSLGATTTIPPGKYIIKDIKTAKALIAAANAAAASAATTNTTNNNNNNNSQAHQLNLSNVITTKAAARIKSPITAITKDTARTITATTTTATKLPTLPPNNVAITQISIKSHKSNNNNNNNSNSNSNNNNLNVIAVTAMTTAAAATTITATETTVTTTLPIECPTCFKVFKKRENLTQHIKLHAGIRPFKCSENDCDKTFSRKEHLHRHLISHTGQKMFSCDVCQKPFSRKDNLSKHRRTHTDSTNLVKYVCEICNKSFSVKAHYQQHKKQHQSKEVSHENEENKKADNEVLATRKVITAVPKARKEDESMNSEVKLNRMTTMQQINSNTQIQLVPILSQQQQQKQQSSELQQHTISTHPATQIMHVQFPTNLISSPNLNDCNTITITQANNHNINNNSNNCNNNNVTLKGLTNNRIHQHNHDAAVLTLPTSLANFVQQAQFVNTTTGQIVGHLKIDK